MGLFYPFKNNSWRLLSVPDSATMTSPPSSAKAAWARSLASRLARKAGKMPSNWEFKSHTYDNCNCSVSCGCGCQFNEPATHGNCHFAYVGTVVQGHFNDTPLSGLNWAFLCIFPGEIAEGNGKRQIIIDERADEAQRSALETIISGEACVPLSNHFSVFGSLCAELFETLFLPIDLEVDLKLRTAKVDIPGVVTQYRPGRWPTKSVTADPIRSSGSCRRKQTCRAGSL